MYKPIGVALVVPSGVTRRLIGNDIGRLVERDRLPAVDGG